MPLLSLPGRIHFIGICGRAMGAVALELQKQGVVVTGSDFKVFAPMDGVLKRGGVHYHESFNAAHLEPRPDCVVVGSYFNDSNVEVAAVKQQEIPAYSLPCFLSKYMLSKGRNIVVAGTNGKTTTTSMLTWILKSARKNPDYMIAGRAYNLQQMTRLRGAKWCVLEGDEYVSAADDKSAKFIHYRPEFIGVTNIQLDHVEVFSNKKDYVQNFRVLVNLMPESGVMIVNADDPDTMALAHARKRGKVLTVGFGRRADYRITRVRHDASGSRFRLMGQDFAMPVFGKIHVFNACLATVLARQSGVSLEQSAAALLHWKGVEGRQQILWKDSRITVIKDEGYHPHALRGTIDAVRAQFPRRHLTVVMQPRYTGGSKGRHQKELPEVLSAADEVFILPPVEIHAFEKPFSTSRLCAALKRSAVPATSLQNKKEFISMLPTLSKRKRVLLVSVSYRNSTLYPMILDALAKG